MHRVLILCLLLSACTQRPDQPVKMQSFDNQSGQIQVFVCGRGCAQFLLKVEGVLYAPVNLPQDARQDQAQVVFSGELMPDSTQINTFGPDDRLIPDFKVRNLNIKHLVKK